MESKRYEISQGDLLIADPLLNDTEFARSVIMMLDVSAEDGIMGLILNCETDLTMHDIMPDWEMGKHLPLFLGGPVERDRLFMLHTLGSIFEGSIHIANGIYVGGKLSDIVQYINDGGKTYGRMRFFLGYSGWSAGQLEGEINSKTWVVRKGETISEDTDMLRGSGNSYWRREVERLGADYRSWLIVPEDPEMN